jgi:hypothetical protein
MLILGLCIIFFIPIGLSVISLLRIISLNKSMATKLSFQSDKSFSHNKLTEEDVIKDYEGRQLICKKCRSAVKIKDIFCYQCGNQLT